MNIGLIQVTYNMFKMNPFTNDFTVNRAFRTESMKGEKSINYMNRFKGQSHLEL